MDINKAPIEQLESAPQVNGPRARYPVDHSSALGAFINWQQVKQVPGFKHKMVENLQAAGLAIAPDNRDESNDTEVRVSEASLDVNRAHAEELARAAQIDGRRVRYVIEPRERVRVFESWDKIKREAPSFEDGMIERLKAFGARLR